MLVRDLIELLEGYDADMEVHFAYGYGDHWRTTVAPRVSNVSGGLVQYSDYHRMDKLVEDEEFEDEEPGNPEENVRRVVVIE
jgi:hypothetical protein